MNNVITKPQIIIALCTDTRAAVHELLSITDISGNSAKLVANILNNLDLIVKTLEKK